MLFVDILRQLEKYSCLVNVINLSVCTCILIDNLLDNVTKVEDSISNSFPGEIAA